MKRFLLCLVSSLLCIPFHAQDDPVVMTVNGKDVPLSEFVYFYNRNNNSEPVTKKSVAEYANLYLNYKLKVEAAIDEGLDKTESFINEYGGYRSMQALEYELDSLYLEETAREAYEQSVIDVGPEGFLLLSVISAFPDDDSYYAFRISASLIDSLYECLQNGEDFNTLARKYSNDTYASAGGIMGWVSKDRLPHEMADAAFSLEVGEYSKPFTVDGVPVLVQVMNHRDLGSYEDNREEIYNWLQESGYYDQSKVLKAESYSARYGWNLKGEAAVARMDSLLEELEPQFGLISKEYYDGLLMFEISNRVVWEKAANDTEGLAKWFKSNRRRYRFDEPRFKGMVFFCKDESVFHQAESAVSALDITHWVDTLVSFNRNGKISLRVMRGNQETSIFSKGQNEYVDKIVFGVGDYSPMKSFPYVNVIGKTIKAPECIDDVADKVLEDYQSHLEKEWVKQLRKKYKSTIYRKVLNAVSLD